MQGIRDTLAGAQSKESPGDRLTGQNGWTEVDGCPLYTNDDFPLSVQQMEDILGKYPNLDAFIPTGGFPQFVPDAYKAVVDKYKDKIASGALALVVADTLPVQIDLMKDGLSRGPGRPAAVRDGLQGHLLPQGHQGRQGGSGRSDLHRPRRLHAQDRRHLRRRRQLSRTRSKYAAGGEFPRPFLFGPATSNGLFIASLEHLFHGSGVRSGRKNQ